MVKVIIQEATKLRYIGEGHTMVRLYQGGEKVRMEEGDEQEFDGRVARILMTDHRNWEFVSSVTDKVIDTDEVQTPDGPEQFEKTLKKMNTQKLEAIAQELGVTFDGDGWTNPKRVAAILEKKYPTA